MTATATNIPDVIKEPGITNEPISTMNPGLSKVMICSVSQISVEVPMIMDHDVNTPGVSTEPDTIINTAGTLGNVMIKSYDELFF